MDNEIKRIVDRCKIHEKKEQLKNDRLKIYQNERDMSKMTFDRKVGLYAYNLDKYLLILEDYVNNNKPELKSKVEELTEYLVDYEKDPDILKYVNLRVENSNLMNRLDEYYKAVNIDLRNELSVIRTPDIYVYIGDCYEHIILPSIYAYEDNYRDYSIYPNNYIYSKRDFRHFYNKTSFHYLEELSQDYSFDLEGKNLGKVLIKKNN